MDERLCPACNKPMPPVPGEGTKNRPPRQHCNRACQRVAQEKMRQEKIFAMLARPEPAYITARRNIPRKTCRACGALLVLRAGEHTTNFRTRNHCNRDCLNEAVRAKWAARKRK